MSGGIWAAVPVKDMAGAKTRLSPVLAADERRYLFRLMLEDVLTALCAAEGLAGVLLITRDAEAAALAGGFGARVLSEPANRGQSAAVAHAAATLRQEGASGMLAVPADVPLLTPGSVERLLAAHGPAPAVTIAPALDRRGTNALLCSPPDLIGLHFGDDSFAPHCEEARRRGIAPAVLDLPDVGLDIDRPDDMAALMARPVVTRAQAWLAESGIARRLAEAAGRPSDQ